MHCFRLASGIRREGAAPGGQNLLLWARKPFIVAVHIPMAKRFKKKKVDRNARPASPEPFPSKSPWATLGKWLPLVMAAVTFLIYWPSLNSGFVYDARKEMLEEGFITSSANLPDVLSLKVLGMNLLLGDRPGQLLYLMLIASVCGKNPFGYHLCSNLLHAVNVALLFVLLRRLISGEVTNSSGASAGKPLLAAVAATLLFAVHPIGVESVSEVSYSSSLLATLFSLLALLAATGFQPQNLRSALLMGGAGTLSAFAAVSCKESGLAAAGALIAYWLIFRRVEAKGPWLLFLGAATAVTGAFLAARFLLAAPSATHLSYLGGSFPGVFLMQPALWIFMMGKLLWPAQLSADYTMDAVNGISVPLSFAVLAIVVLLQGWLAWRSRLGALGMALFWLGLLTVSNFVPLYHPLADRFYYLPLAGVAMQLLALLLITPRSGRGFGLVLAPCLVALVPLSLLTLTREDVFADEFSLWTDTLRVSPLSFGAYNGLGNDLVRKGQVDAAMVQYHKALEINNGYVEAHNNLGFAYFQKGQLDDAIVQYRKALEIDPNYAYADYNLGLALAHKGQMDAAMDLYQKALAINPRYADACNNLGSIFSQKGRVDKAIALYRKALEIDADDVAARVNLGNVLLQKGQVDEAIIQYQEALKIDPNFDAAKQNLAAAQAGSRQNHQ
jgi:protein O-mannosyl-transferase